MLYMFTESAGLCSGCFLGLQAPPLIMCSLSPEDQRGLELSGVRATPSLPGGPYLHGSWPLGLPAYLPLPGFLAHLLPTPPPQDSGQSKGGGHSCDIIPGCRVRALGRTKASKAPSPGYPA